MHFFSLVFVTVIYYVSILVLALKYLLINEYIYNFL